MARVKKRVCVIYTAIALAVVMLAGYSGIPAQAKAAPVKQKAGWIYFVDKKEQLYRSHPDGSSKSAVSNVATFFYAVSGDWIYYNPSESGIYKIRGDGTGKTKVSSLVCAIIGISGKYMYISYADGGGGSGSDFIYRITLDGKDLKRLSKSFAYDGEGFVSNGYVYFSDGNSLYRVRTDGTGETKIAAGEGTAASYFISTEYVVLGGSIYYAVFTDKDVTKARICKIRTDGSGKTFLPVNDAFNIAAVDGILYYKTYGGKIYRLSSDGKNKTTVNPSSWTAARAFGSKNYCDFKS